MRTFMLWDYEGVLVDSERWYFVSTKEGPKSLGVNLERQAYLDFMLN